MAEAEAETTFVDRVAEHLTKLFTRLRTVLGCAPAKIPSKRTIKVNHLSSSVACFTDSDAVEGHQKFIDNTVISSKYTILNFVPKNLFEQFKRVANFYFLCVGIIILSIADKTPVNPTTSILPLIFVISVTAVKQGYEDYRRHSADKEVNLKTAHVIRNGNLVEIMSKQIAVGDIVRVSVNHSFPCDMVLVSSSEDNGSCFVTTANLDGETNLKQFSSLLETRQYNSVEKLCEINAVIQCEQPITDLYRFIGRINVNGKILSLGPNNVLLRGARLRDTAHIYGCAIYTGQETKMALNSKFKGAKFSRVEKSMNSYLIVCLVFLVFECSVSVGLKYGFINRYFNSDDFTYTYLPAQVSLISLNTVVINLLSFLILYNYIIPISLYVTIEIQKFVGSQFFAWDLEMYDGEADLPAKANTSDLNEELGQIQYLFSDKTGTLTENDMQFRQCFIAGRSYTDVDGVFCYMRTEHDTEPEPVLTHTKDMNDFFMVLSLCHSCQIEKKSEEVYGDLGASAIYSTTGGMEYNYQASSPDEKAFLEAVRRYGIVYHGIRDNKMEVSFKMNMQRYEVLHTLEFDATRKRMSVIVRDEKGVIYVLCKGAESALFDRIHANDIRKKTYEKIDRYASIGLRTLVIANKILSAVQYKELDFVLNESRTSMEHRDEMLAQAFDRVEQNLHLLGCTAIEDRLQDDVPEVISSLVNAGIKVWVLTGDKEETAVNISYSAGHFHPGVVELRVTKMDNSEETGKLISSLVEQLEKNREIDIDYVLVVDGFTLNYLLNDHRDQFRLVGSYCTGVLCCRLSPIQKAEVVKMIKLSREHPVTAAIGDGANDVSMIQEAHVGLGIIGKEGRQAARCSDYAYSKFKYTKRVLLVHGHFFYHRIAVMVQYFFYKNVAFITAQFFFIFMSAYSQQTLYQSFLLTFYNLTCTSLPIFIFGLFEQHIPQQSLMDKPALYKNVTGNEMLKWKHFVRWTTLGLWHSFVFFFGVFFLIQYDTSLFSDGKNHDNYSFGCIVYTTCVFAVNVKLALETWYWCVPIFLSYVITIGGFFILIFFQGQIYWPFFFDNDIYGTFAMLYSSVTVWLTIFLLIIAALLPDIAIKALENRKTLQHDLKTAKFIQPITSVSSAMVKMVRAHTLTRDLSKRINQCINSDTHHNMHVDVECIERTNTISITGPSDVKLPEITHADAKQSIELRVGMSSSLRESEEIRKEEAKEKAAAREKRKTSADDQTKVRKQKSGYRRRRTLESMDGDKEKINDPAKGENRKRKKQKGGDDAKLAASNASVVSKTPKGKRSKTAKGAQKGAHGSKSHGPHASPSRQSNRRSSQSKHGNELQTGAGGKRVQSSKSKSGRAQKSGAHSQHGGNSLQFSTTASSLPGDAVNSVPSGHEQQPRQSKTSRAVSPPKGSDNPGVLPDTGFRAFQMLEMDEKGKEKKQESGNRRKKTKTDEV